MGISIKKTRFSFEDFLTELTQKELLFLLFISRQDIAEHTEQIMQKYKSVEHFLQAHLKKERKFLQQIPNETARKMALETFRDTDHVLLGRTFKKGYDREFLSFSTHLHGLYCLIHLLFKDKTEQAHDNVDNYQNFTNHEEWVKKEESFFEKHFLIPQKPHTNLLGLSLLMGCTNVELEQSQQEKKDAYFTRLCLLTQYIGKQNEQIVQNEIDRLKTVYRKTDEQLSRQAKDLEKKKKQLEQALEQQKILTNEVKQLKKQGYTQTNEKDSALYLQLSQQLEKKDEEMERLRKQLDVALTKTHPIYENMIEKLNEQLYFVKEEAKEKRAEVKELTKTVQSYEQETVLSFLNRYFEHHEMDKQLYHLLQETLDAHKEAFSIPKTSHANSNPIQPRISEIPESTNRIGYAILENNVFYVQFADKTKIELKNIPPYIYLGQHQFILVSGDGSFKWLYNSLYQQDQTYVTQSFVVANRKEDEIDVRFLDANGKHIDVKNVPSLQYIKNNQVLSISNNGYFQRFFPTAYVNADVHLASIKEKGQEAYYVLDCQWNGYNVRQIDTGEELFLSLDYEGVIYPRQILCVEGNRVCHVFQHSQFYTLSSYYTYHEYGTVHFQNGKWMVKKLSGEMAELENLPHRIDFEEGDAITVDEHNQLLRIVQTENTSFQTVEFKKMAALSQKAEKEKKSTDARLSKRVLIIGKITYEESYRCAFQKKGYSTEIVDGYSPWSRVKAKTKNQDTIVVVTNFISHENMWRLKDEVLDTPIIYSELDGANQIAERLKA